MSLTQKIIALSGRVTDLTIRVGNQFKSLSARIDLLTASSIDMAAVDAKIQAIVGAAPDALNTLEEIGIKLGESDNLAAALTNQIAGKAALWQVEGLETAVAGKAALWQVEGLETAVAGKAALWQVEGLQTAVDGKASLLQLSGLESSITAMIDRLNALETEVAGANVVDTNYVEVFDQTLAATATASL